MSIDPFKSDVFSFGLIMLELGTLKHLKPEKDMENFKKNISAHIKEFKQNYSDCEDCQVYLRTIRNCLKIDTKERPDFLDLFKEIIDKSKLTYHIFVEEAKSKKLQKIDWNDKLKQKDKDMIKDLNDQIRIFFSLNFI